MKTYTPNELKATLDAHYKWLKGEEGGARADLSNANLSSANLRSANLSLANLSLANLSVIKHDMWAVLAHAPLEVPELIAALDEGRVNGSTYSDGQCGCLVGTLAIAAGADPAVDNSCVVVHDLDGDSSRPIESFFMAIKKGDTPETNQASKLARDWAQEWLERMTRAFKERSHA